MTISRSQIPQQINKGVGKMMKKKGYKKGGKVKMNMGGKVKKKGYAMGGKVSPRKMMAIGMKMGGKVNNLKKAIKKVKAKSKKK